MKKIIIAIIIALTAAISAIARNDQPVFKDVATIPGVTYSYISPSMLATMGNRTINTKSIRISASELSSIESIRINGTTDPVQQAMGIVKKIIKKEKLETLATKSNGATGSSTSVFGRTMKGGKHLSHLLMLESSSSGTINITYLTGKISFNFNDLNF